MRYIFFILLMLGMTHCSRSVTINTEQKIEELKIADVHKQQAVNIYNRIVYFRDDRTGIVFAAIYNKSFGTGEPIINIVVVPSDDYINNIEKIDKILLNP